MSNQQNQTEIDDMLEKSEMPSEEAVTEEVQATEKEEPIPEEDGETTEADADEAEAEKDGKSKKGFKKKSKEDKKVEALQEKVTDLEDRVKRQMAEFENFRKRSEKEKSAMFETGAKSVIERILPIVDNFE